MNKLLVFTVCGVLALASCNQGRKPVLNPSEVQNDSLRNTTNARDHKINDTMGTLNDIQQGFAAVNEAENRVTIAKNGGHADKAEQMKENIQFIAQCMQEDRELVKKLQQQLCETGFEGDTMKEVLSRLTSQLSAKEIELKQLCVELGSKDIHIKELDETITGLSTDVINPKTDGGSLTTERENLTKEKENLQTEGNQKTEVINIQDKQLNAGQYVFDIKSELKAQRIFDGGKVPQDSFSKGYFTKIDIRVNKGVKLYSKSTRLLTAHPSSSYTLTTDINGQYVLRITGPQTSWSVNKYLVVQVR